MHARPDEVQRTYAAVSARFLGTFLVGTPLDALIVDNGKTAPFVMS